MQVFEAAAASRLPVTARAAPSLPDLHLDGVQLVQVLTNLMLNAEQASQGRSDEQISLEAEPAPGSGQIRLRVADNGPGIPKEIARRIFDPLLTTKAIGKGTGIGLALCQRLVLAHGGHIAPDPTTRLGAAFVIDLPIRGDG